MKRWFAPLAPLAMSSLPARQVSVWRLLGPGAILVGLSIGAGELVVWPRIVAEYGASMAWAAMAGVFLQVWINLEVGRWTIATGETVFTGYSRVWRGFGPVFIILTLMGWLAPGWGIASGLALKALLLGPTWHVSPEGVPTDFLGSNTFWIMVTFAGVSLTLFGPKLVYRSVEHTIEALVVIVVVGLVLVAGAVGTRESWVKLGAGLVNVGFKEPAMPVKDFFIALVFAGAGGTANLFYSFYLRDKHIGMGARVPQMVNALRGRTEKAPATGYTFADDAEQRQRFKRWFDFIKLDQALFFWVLNSFTIMLFIFGALAVLHPKGIVPGAGTLIWDEAAILGEVWGKPGRSIFLLVGLATLFSTQLALVDGVARSLADIIYTNFAWAQRRDVGWWYFICAAGFMLVGCLITFVMEQRRVSDLGFLFNAAYMGGFAMAVYVPLQLFINLRYLPAPARPGWICRIMMTLACVVYVGFAAACLVWEVGKRLG